MRFRWYLKLGMVVAVVALIAPIVAACAGETETVTQTQTTTQTKTVATTETVTTTLAPGAALTVTQTVPGPTVTTTAAAQTITQTVPGPTVTRTVGDGAVPTDPTQIYDKVKLVISCPWPTSMRQVMTVMDWMEYVTAASGGNITWEAYWGGALGGPSDHLEILRIRDADLVLTHAWYTPGMLPIGNMTYTFPFGPGGWQWYDVIAKAGRQMIEEFPQFKADLAKYNARHLMSISSDTYNLLSKTPITGIADFKGKRIAAIGRYFGRWVGEPVGATALVSQITERYQSLQSGLEDIDLLSPTMWAAYKLYEQAGHWVDVPIGSYAFMVQLWINTNAFNELNPATQHLLTSSALMWEQNVYPRWLIKAEREALQIMFDYGVTEFHISDADRAAWASKVPDTPAEFAAEVTEKGYPGYDLVRRWQEITADLGFKWPRQWGVKQ